MDGIGTWIIVLLVAAVILMLYALIQKSGMQGGGFKPNIWMILIAYLIFWYFYRFTTIFPYSFKNLFSQNLLDTLAFIDIAILIIYGMMKANQRFPNPNTGGGGPGGMGPQGPQGPPGAPGSGGSGSGAGGGGGGGGGGGAGSGGATTGGAAFTLNQQFSNQVDLRLLMAFLNQEGASSSPTGPALPPAIQRVRQRVRSLFDLKQKYQSYSFAIFNRRKDITKLRRGQMLKALELIIKEANKVGCPPDRFLRSGSNGGIGSTNCKTPIEIRNKLVSEGLL